ncbi:MAG: DUF4339 domain-containing protein [Candidatus Omnitrophica bacterium]|nr:DUF4339 domain-containing protein [Candidatus Omnitrophota bacterium]
MGTVYYFGKDNQKIGPFDREAVKKKVTEGQITSQMLAWCEGMNNWKPAGEIQELAELFKGRTQPPPLPADKTTPPPLPGDGMPGGLSPLEEKAYRFATAVYRPWRGKLSPLGIYVRKNPKNSVYVSLGTIAVMVLAVIFIALAFTPGGDQDQAQQYPQGQQQMMMSPDAAWRAQHRAVMDAQSEASRISDEVYKYRRDRQDAADDYRRRVLTSDD